MTLALLMRLARFTLLRVRLRRTLRIHPTFLAPQEGTTPALRSLLSCARTVLLFFIRVARAPPRGSALRRDDTKIRFIVQNELS